MLGLESIGEIRALARSRFVWQTGARYKRIPLSILKEVTDRSEYSYSIFPCVLVLKVQMQGKSVADRD
jgi:hypothetical protein